MAVHSLQHALKTIDEGGTGTFGPICCHIVNYDSDHASPWKYVYQACSYEWSIGRWVNNLRSHCSSNNIRCSQNNSRDCSHRFCINSRSRARSASAEVIVSYPKLVLYVRVTEGRLIVSRIMRTEVGIKNFIPVSASVRRGQSASCSNSAARSNVRVDDPQEEERPVSYAEFADLKKCLYDIMQNMSSNRTDEWQPSESVDFSKLDRKELQQWSKKYGLPAKKSNAAMAEALKDRLKQVKK